MKRFGWTALFLGLGVVCAVQAWRNFRVFARPPDARFSAPGEFRFTAPDSATYTLWQDLPAQVITVSIGGVEAKVTRGTKAAETDLGLPAGTTVTVRQDASAVTVRASPGVTMSFGNQKRKSVLEFDGTKGSEYVFTVAGLPGAQQFLLTHNPLLRPLLGFMAWGAAALGLGVLAVLFLVLALTGVLPRRPKGSRT